MVACCKSTIVERFSFFNKVREKTAPSTSLELGIAENGTLQSERDYQKGNPYIDVTDK